MICIVREYFKDSSGKWHQPGNIIDLTSEEADEMVEQGRVIVQTRMVEPEKRRGRRAVT